MDRQFQRPGVQHQHPSYSQSTSPYPPTSSTPTAAGQKRTADQAVLSQDIDDQANDSFDPGEGVEVKDETDSIADQASRLTAGIQGRKNRSAAPPLKRGTACMLCRKRKLVSSCPSLCTLAVFSALLPCEIGHSTDVGSLNSLIEMRWS